jgi:hypothetical protein
VNKVLQNYHVKMPQTFHYKINITKIQVIKKNKFFTARTPSKRNLCKDKTGCDGVFHCKRDNDVGIF